MDGGIRVMGMEGIPGIKWGEGEAKAYGFHLRTGAYNGWWWWCEAAQVLKWGTGRRPCAYGAKG